MTYTGGLLNELNGKMGISAPSKSVPVMNLIKAHQPKSKDALVQLIDYHYKNICHCGVVSKGTVEMFGTNLYESQLSYWNETKFTLQECIQWEYDLFVIQSLKGGKMEKIATRSLSDKLPRFEIEEATGYLDQELRIDLVIKQNSIVVAGIQVKPLTFTRMRQSVISFNKKANKKWKNPVYYMYYTKEESFNNLEEIVSQIKLTNI